MQRLKNFGFLLKDVTRLYTRHFEQRAAQLGMTLPQCKVLGVLARNEGATQVQLAELTDTDPMTLVRILDRMEQDDWIERRPDPKDRRVRRLHLRPASESVLAEIWRVADKARGDALAGLTAAEHTQLMSLLERVHDNLLALVPGAGDGSRAGAAAPGALGPRRRARRSARVSQRERRTA